MKWRVWLCQVTGGRTRVGTRILHPSWCALTVRHPHSPAAASWEAKMAPRGFGRDLLQAFIQSTSIYWVSTTCKALFLALEVRQWMNRPKSLPSWSLDRSNDSRTNFHNDKICSVSSHGTRNFLASFEHISILACESKCISCSWVNLPDQVWPPADGRWLWIPCLESAYSHGQSTLALRLLWAIHVTIKDPGPCFSNCVTKYMHVCVPVCVRATPEKMFREIAVWDTFRYFLFCFNFLKYSSWPTKLIS